MHGLSKSKIMDGLQCPRLLWLKVHSPELVEYDAATQHVFAMGHEVGRLAQSLYAGGVQVGPQRDGPLSADDLRRAQAETQRLLAEPGDVALYEATFVHDGVLVRADVLMREDGRCRLVEVKSGTKLKPHYATDAAIQVWVLQAAGVRVERVAIAHVDREFVYAGDGDYSGLLVEEDVTDQVLAVVPAIPGHVAELRAMLDGDCPPSRVGPHCSTPNACPLKEHCCREVAEYHVACLPHGGQLVPVLQDEGYFDLRDVPARRLVRPEHVCVWRATCTGEPEIAEALGAELGELAYPRYYLDFETVGFAVPVWAGTRPYEQLPVQFSCHVEHADGRLEHRDFLDVSGEPPMRACAEAVVAVLGDHGSVLTYTAFEEQRLAWMAAAYPDLAPALTAIIDRIVDLHSLLREHYYHPRMRGSWSIKALAPTVVPELSYDDLDEVRDGTAAQAAFAEAIRPETSPQRREELRNRLLAYCERDTEAMVRLVRHFAPGGRPSL